MPMSDYTRHLRSMIGTTVLEVPTVSVLTFDDDGRVLLVRHAEGNDWTTPGGMIEPYETPADAAVREMWEETGLHVELTRLIGVFGGELCTSTYSNGDRLSWVSTAFAGRPVGDALRPDGAETLEVRYFEREAIRAVRCKAHVQAFIDAGFSPDPNAHFQRPTWQPPPP
ncbi:MAG: NUDIX domain-containing protein [Casimicrobiaceae bacterium]